MAGAAGYVLVAGGIAAGNELVSGNFDLTKFNWRIIPATGILALVLEGLDKVEPGFGRGLGMLVLLAVFVIPVGSGPTPLDTATSIISPAK